MIATVLILGGLLLAFVHLWQSEGRDILGWAVVLLGLALALPIIEGLL